MTIEFDPDATPSSTMQWVPCDCLNPDTCEACYGLKRKLVQVKVNLTDETVLLKEK